MQLSFEHFTVELFNESDYDLNSSDNINSYQLEHFAEERRNYTNRHGIKVTDSEQEFSALIFADGGSTGIHDNCAIITDEQLTICCGDQIFCLTLPELQLQWNAKADEATCFQIKSIEQGYIIHGELEISRIDQLGKIVWQQSGTDIFVDPDGRENFELTSESIRVSDWYQKEYSFDFDGNPTMPKDLLELIDTKSFRERPGMWLGSKDINILKAFIEGYLFPNECSGTSDHLESFFKDFRDWLTVKLNQPNTTGGWNHIILKATEENSSQAVDRFFTLLDECRQTIQKDANSR